MNILIYSTNYPTLNGPGGIGTYTKHLAHALADLGQRVQVVTHVDGSPRSHLSDGAVQVEAVPAGYLPILDRVVPGAGACMRLRSSMRSRARRYRADVVEFPNWGGDGLGFVVRRPVPVVVRLHTSSLTSSEIDGLTAQRAARWDSRRERWLSLAADALVTHSLAQRRKSAQELRIDEERIAVVPHGIAVDPKFRRPPRAGPGLTVVYLGRMERRKGTLDLIRAIPEVIRRVPEASFVLIGADRPHCPGGRTHAQYIAQELPAEARARIELTGELSDDEVDRRLQRADLFVAPSLYESFGLIFLEAMRWGTPVLGTATGGIPEIVEDGRSGLLVPPEDPERLAAAIVNLLTDESLRCRLGEAGRRRVETRFTVEQMARGTLRVYEQALEQWRCRAS
ncbi:glycosyltransferase family 4 protein [Paludisphaera rhizosphaerae]|uniref:glycosyltransferase family 4 protein n=1 Tax=Paludisphaera rhizosphaerae TaxID=2711216 RepID=UPI0013EDA77E|nr:glycosyltransferase family 4 protein [Paludisphaera rhizosphaerae]